MSIDPLTEAAREIAERQHYLDVDEVRAIIVAHLGTRFDPNVAYMPVPRCETCRQWGKYADGDCPVILGPTAADFGCVQWRRNDFRAKKSRVHP